MAQAIIIGGITVPIVRTYHFPNQATPTAVPGISTSAFEVWSDGVTYARASYGPSSGQSDTFGDSNLDIHDNTYIQFKEEVLDPDIYLPGLVIRVKSFRNGAEASLPGFILGDFSVYPGTRGNPPYVTTYETRLAAIMFDFPDATDPMWRIPNYYVYNVQGKVIYREDGSIRETDYPFTRLLFNFAYANYYNSSYQMYLNPIDEPDPDEPFDPSEDNPYPDIPPSPDTSDTINIPGNPLIGVTTAGFINVYNPAINALQGLGDILFPQFTTPTDIVNAVEQLYNVIANQNLINYVIDCHVIPVTPQTGSAVNIKVGYRDTGIAAPKVTNDYIDATCGSLSIPEYFHGYQDYITTRSKIYLPFVGFVDTKPEYWQAGTISVDYKFNVIDGSFMAYIRSVSSKSALNGSVIAQYAGNACMHFPITGVNYANMVSGIVGAAAGAITTGGASAVLGGAWSAANTLAQGGNVQQSNGYNSTAALMGVREAFLLIERPVPAFPSKYSHDKGYPSNISTQLSNVHGYTEIEDIDLSGIPLTQVELDELRGLLKEGVYF